MPEKTPVLLVVLVESSRLRWLAGGIDFNNDVYPLLVSEDDNLSDYLTKEFDEQVSFLRHRFCSVVQRACDRLWGIHKKAIHFVFVVEHDFPDAPSELTDRVSSHLADWMTNPPVCFYSVDEGTFDARPLNLTSRAGNLDHEGLETLQAALPKLCDARNNSDSWELVASRKQPT